MCYTYRSIIFCGRSGACSVMKKFAPSSSSFSAFLLPAFHRFSSVQVRKCCQTSHRESTGCRQTELTNACSWALRCSMNCSSYLPASRGGQPTHEVLLAAASPDKCTTRYISGCMHRKQPLLLTDKPLCLLSACT
jgi:hypothetical protein